MARLGRLAALILLAASLTGCFRQADSESQAVTLDTPSTSSAPTLPPVQIEPTSTVPLLVTVAATDTPDPAATEIRSNVTPTATETSQTFITPQSPFSTLVVGTATFTPGTPGSATPGGLITPTDFLNNPDVEGSDNVCEYEVRSGDSLFRIAINNNTTVNDIKALNQLASDSIFPGDILKIPGCGEGTSGSVQATEAPDAGATPLPDGWRIHTVSSGEVLGAIAERYGIGQSRIIEVNQLSNPNSLSVGQRLVIPSP